MDPNDPEVRRERALAKRAGIKPPESPIVPPVAARPKWLSEIRMQQYRDELAKSQPASQVVSLDDWVEAANAI